VSSQIKNKLKSKQTASDIIYKNLNCRDNANQKDSLQKLRVLQQTTYELCKYHAYLEYLDERSNSIKNIITPDIEESYDISYIADSINKKQNEIKNE